MLNECPIELWMWSVCALYLKINRRRERERECARAQNDHNKMILDKKWLHVLHSICSNWSGMLMITIHYMTAKYYRFKEFCVYMYTCIGCNTQKKNHKSTHGNIIQKCDWNFWQKPNEQNNYAIIDRINRVEEREGPVPKLACCMLQNPARKNSVDTENGAHHEWHNITTMWWQCGRNSM